MLKLSGEQLLDLEGAWRETFDRQLAEQYRRDVPEATGSMDDATLLARVAAAHERALKHGIQTQRGIAQFVGLDLMAGPGFDEVPSVRTLLANPVVSPDYTIDLLTEQLASAAPGRA